MGSASNCESGQRGHLPCRTVPGSPQTALRYELLRAQILDTHGSDQGYHLSALTMTHSPAPSSTCSTTPWLPESNQRQKQMPKPSLTPGWAKGRAFSPSSHQAFLRSYLLFQVLRTHRREATWGPELGGTLHTLNMWQPWQQAVLQLCGAWPCGTLLAISVALR